MSQFAVSGPNKPWFRAGPGLKPRSGGRWYLPLVATIALGFGAYKYYLDAKARLDLQILEEENRMARNQRLMDAYGNKDSLEDVQQALDTYQVR